jgi:membrane protease YdiL (CAAX protease family)
MIFAKPKNNFSALLWLFFLTTIAYIFAQGLLLLMIYLKTGSVQDAYNTINFAYKYPNYFKTMQIFQSITLFLLPAIAFPFFVGENTSTFFGLKKIKLSTILSLFLLIIILMPFINYSAELNKNLPIAPALYEKLKQGEEHITSLISHLLDEKGVGVFLLNLTVFAIVPAIAEEFFFRGTLQKILIDIFKNVDIAIFITALIFSFVHFQFLTFIPRLILGIILGYLYVWSRNLWVSITTHFFNNSMVVLIHTFFQGNTQHSIENLGSEANLISIIFNAFVIIVILYSLKKYFDNGR